MKKILYVSLMILSTYLVSCSGDEGNVEVKVSSSPFPLIPATAVSCLANQSANGEPPTADVQPSYFRIPTVTFVRKDTKKSLIIAFIRITIPIPGETAPVSCEVGGDNLMAIGKWGDGTGTSTEALILPGVESFSTNCALYCGGIKAEKTYTTSGTMEVYGLERDTAGNETPVRTSTSVTIQSF